MMKKEENKRRTLVSKVESLNDLSNSLRYYLNLNKTKEISISFVKEIVQELEKEVISISNHISKQDWNNFAE